MLVALVGTGAAVAITSWLRRRPQRGVLLLAALLPFNGLLQLLPHHGGISAWKEGLVLLTLACALLAPEAARASLDRRPPAWALPAAGLVLLGIVSIATTAGHAGRIGFKVTYFYYLLPLIIWRCPFSARDRDRLVTILMTTSVATAAFGIVQQILGGERLHQLGFEWNTALRTSGGRLRSISTFSQPFPFAFFVTMALLIALPVALADVNRRRNLFFLLSTPVLIFGMLTAIVRGAIIGLAAGLIYLAFSRHRALLHLAVVAFVVVLMLPGGFLKVLTSSSSLGQRQSGWGRTAGLIAERPLGWGLGTVGAAAEKAYPVPDDSTPSFGLPIKDLPYQPDNQYVNIGLQLGVLGLWLFVLILRGAYKEGRRVSALPVPADAALGAGITASIIAAVVGALVATYWEIFPLDAYFWMILGLLLSIGRVSPSTPWPSAPAAAGFRPTSESSSEPSPV